MKKYKILRLFTWLFFVNNSNFILCGKRRKKYHLKTITVPSERKTMNITSDTFQVSTHSNILEIEEIQEEISNIRYISLQDCIIKLLKSTMFLPDYYSNILPERHFPFLNFFILREEQNRILEIPQIKEEISKIRQVSLKNNIIRYLRHQRFLPKTYINLLPAKNFPFLNGLISKEEKKGILEISEIKEEILKIQDVSLQESITKILQNNSFLPKYFLDILPESSFPFLNFFIDRRNEFNVFFVSYLNNPYQVDKKTYLFNIFRFYYEEHIYVSCCFKFRKNFFHFKFNDNISIRSYHISIMRLNNIIKSEIENFDKDFNQGDIKNEELNVTQNAIEDLELHSIPSTMQSENFIPSEEENKDISSNDISFEEQSLLSLSL